MFQSDFYNFLGPGNTKEVNVENQACMTRFCTLNIPTLFWSQLLSFLIRTTEKCFSQILTTFSSPGTTEAGKVENEAQMTQFCTRNIPILFGVQFLSFGVNTAEKCFDRILTMFFGPKQYWSRQSLKPGPDNSILRPKRTQIVCGAINIVYHQYD